MFPECPFWKWDQLPLASTWCYKLQTTQTVFIPQPTNSESIMEEIFALLLYFQIVSYLCDFSLQYKSNS